MKRKSFLRVTTLAAAVALDLVLFRPTMEPSAGSELLAFAQGDFVAAMAVQERHNPDLLNLPGVAGTAVAIGADGRPVVKVLLVNAGVIGIPATLDGHALVTEVTGAFRALGEIPAGAGTDTDPRQSFPRPVPIGVSTGQVDVTAGTIAARVVSGADVFALSNNHVYANRNAANLGDHILQPGTVDGGVNPTDAIGTLHDYEPIKFCSPFPRCPANRIDAAIAATTTGEPREQHAVERLRHPALRNGGRAARDGGPEIRTHHRPHHKPCQRHQRHDERGIPRWNRPLCRPDPDRGG